MDNKMTEPAYHNPAIGILTPDAVKFRSGEEVLLADIREAQRRAVPLWQRVMAALLPKQNVVWFILLVLGVVGFAEALVFYPVFVLVLLFWIGTKRYDPACGERIELCDYEGKVWLSVRVCPGVGADVFADLLNVAAQAADCRRQMRVFKEEGVPAEAQLVLKRAQYQYEEMERSLRESLVSSQRLLEPHLPAIHAAMQEWDTKNKS